MSILSHYKGFVLCRNKDFYFIKGIDYADVGGTKEYILKELKRWKNEVDSNNKYMLDIENHFIQILERQ